MGWWQSHSRAATSTQTRLGERLAALRAGTWPPGLEAPGAGPRLHPRTPRGSDLPSFLSRCSAHRKTCLQKMKMRRCLR